MEITDYKSCVGFLFTQLPTFHNIGADAYKPGLDTTLNLSSLFGDPHKHLRTIHVGGTNGKGSTAHTIAAVLQSAGYRTGLFTSPHLTDFRERIRINGKMIPESRVIEFTQRYLSEYHGETRPSFFELTTVMALDYFASEHVDVAVIEVGLGGRLDSTNIITPELSVVTNISPDHTALLGDTLEKIAAEKAGIFKHGVPAIVGNASGSVKDVFTARAQYIGSPLTIACENRLFSSCMPSGEYLTYHDTPFGDLKGELTGDCQPENANTILHALVALQNKFPEITPASVAIGFANVTSLTGLAGRWQRLEYTRRPDLKVICDTGHNPGAWDYLGPRLHDIAENGNLTAVLGFVSDKDVSCIMTRLPQSATYIFCQPSVARARSAASTAEIAASHGISGTVVGTGSVAESVTAALDNAPADSTVFIGGSTFVISELLDILHQRPHH